MVNITLDKVSLDCNHLDCEVDVYDLDDVTFKFINAKNKTQAQEVSLEELNLIKSKILPILIKCKKDIDGCIEKYIEESQEE